jgi:hypothetical protein
LYKPTSSTAITSEPAMTFDGPKSQTVWTNASTSWANVAADTLQLWPRPGREWTWITVEIKTTANTCNLHGFHEWWLGPLT